MAASDAIGETYEHELDDGAAIAWDDVPDDGRASYDVDEPVPYEHELVNDDDVVWSSAEFIRVTSDGPTYGGPYDVVPRLERQTLQTADKLMSHDVAVEGIPNYRTTNQSGGYTVVIAQD